MKRPLLFLVGFAIGAGLYVAPKALADSHVLVVDGVSYTSTKETPGGTISWETPDANPTSALFAERNQTWDYGGNGSDHLPCQYGIHWISNANVLTVSNCLEAPPSTSTTSTTTTTIAPSTSTSTTSTTSTTTTLPATTTTVIESTSTSSPSTTSPESTSTSTTASTSTSSVASTSTPTTQPTASSTTAPASTSTSIAPVNQPLPKTGSREVIGQLLIALGVLLIGWAGVYVARRKA